MTVYRPKGSKVFRYNFEFHNRRYSKSTGLKTKREAEEFERTLQRKLRERAAGVAIADPADSPRIQEWADVVMKDAKRRVDHPDRVEQLLRRVLQFFGRQPSGRDPKNPIVPGAPYHDLTLAQVAQNPDWVLQFEDWISEQMVAVTPPRRADPARSTLRRPMSAQTQNQHRSAVSGMFKLAASPLYRKTTGVVANPFHGIERPRGRRRTVALSIDEIGLWLEHASRHVALAMVIAVLAPKLRLSNILELRWTQIDAALETITVLKHKTARETGRPLIVRISAPLRELLQRIRADQPRKTTHVVLYRGTPVQDISGGVHAAATRAGIPYGLLADDGATFHTIRHSLATLLARLHRVDQQRPLTPDERMRMFGHLSFSTTQWYTHLAGEDDVEPAERVGAIAAPFVDLALTRRRRAAGAETGATDRNRDQNAEESVEISAPLPRARSRRK